MTEPLLHLEGVRKGFRDFSLDDVGFSLPAGSLMGLIGPNGAGKTTLLKALMGLVPLDAGRIRFQGQDLIRHGATLRQQIAHVPDEPKFSPGAKLGALKAVYASFFPSWKEAHWVALMEEFGLDPRATAGSLSLGQRTRFALSLALSREATLLVLDEPTTGLDPTFRRELLQRLSATLDEHRAVLFSTHITSDLEDRADYVTLLRDGQVVFSQTQEELRETWGLIKGGLELLDSGLPRECQGLRIHAHGFEALTPNLEAARRAYQDKALVERASLEDILVLMGRKRTHAA